MDKYITNNNEIKKINTKSNLIKINDEIVNNIINKLDSTSAPGVDGFSPESMKELWQIRNMIPDLESNIINFLQIMINGRIPVEISKAVFACRLISLIKKKEGNNVLDVRPICIPTTFCRLAQNICIQI